MLDTDSFLAISDQLSANQFFRSILPIRPAWLQPEKLLLAC